MNRPKQRKKLDDALSNFQQISLDMSRKVKKAVKSLDPEVYDFQQLTRATKQLADTAKIYVEIAPFYAAKQSLEGIDHYREYILHSEEYTGEIRERILESIKTYEQIILSDVGFLEREQYQLL